MITNYNANTSDRQKETLWEVDQDDTVVGPVTRAECHNETRKPWHRTTHVYLFNKEGKLYLSQRSFAKDTAPGCWTVSAGGHVQYNFNPLDTAEKEVGEELGILAKLEQIDKLIVDYGTEREVIYIFAGVTDKKPKFNPNEVNQVKLFDFQTLIDDFANGKFDLSGGSRDSFKHVINSGSLFKFRQKI